MAPSLTLNDIVFNQELWLLPTNDRDEIVAVKVNSAIMRSDGASIETTGGYRHQLSHCFTTKAHAQLARAEKMRTAAIGMLVTANNIANAAAAPAGVDVPLMKAA